MSCAPCKSTVLGQTSLPGGPSAYLVDEPVCTVPTGTVSVDSCGLVKTPTFNAPCTYNKGLVDYIPAWIQKLTGRKKGTLLVKNGDTLARLESANPGPVQYDGNEYHVGYQQHASHLGGDDAVVASGYLPLAYLDQEQEADDKGAITTREVYRHGIQQVNRVGVGEMMGLTVDCFTGKVRQDVIEPIRRDLIKETVPEGFRRLGYTEESVTDGCKISKIKKWFSYVGAAFAKDEILEDKSGQSREPSLIPTGEGGFTLAYRNIQDSDSVLEDDQADYRLAVCKVVTDPDNASVIIGHSREFIPFPDILLPDNYQDILDRLDALETP